MDGKRDQDLSGRAPAPVAADRRRRLTPEAERALAEAAARRAELDRKVAALPKEFNRREGPEPTRYDDWETKGIASDF